MTSTSVLLLRDVPEQRLRSMERFADELERGFADREGIHYRSMALHTSDWAARSRLGALDSALTRFVRYPLAARAQRADVYHIADHGYAHVAALLPRERVVASCHDLTLLRAAEGAAGFRGGRLATGRFRWSTSFLARVARVVTCSEATKRDIVRLRHVAPERIHVVPYGVSDAFRPLPAPDREALRSAVAGSGRQLLLHVCTGDPYKNTPATLRVLAALRATGHDIILARAGAPLRPAERALAASLGVLPSVRDLGRVSESRLVELYNAADLLLFPSHYEGFGWPPLEAMACGTPVVASDCDALREITGGAALLASACDIAALTSNVRRILASPALADDLRRRGVARAAEYTWQRTIDGFAAVYDTVAEDAARVEGLRSQGQTACAG